MENHEGRYRISVVTGAGINPRKRTYGPGSYATYVEAVEAAQERADKVKQCVGVFYVRPPRQLAHANEVPETEVERVCPYMPTSAMRIAGGKR